MILQNEQKWLFQRENFVPLLDFIFDHEDLPVPMLRAVDPYGDTHIQYDNAQALLHELEILEQALPASLLDDLRSMQNIAMKLLVLPGHWMTFVGN